MYETTVKPVLSSHSKITQKWVFNTNYCLMQVKSIRMPEHSAILLTFIKLPFSITAFVLSIFKWPLKTGFTVDAFIFDNIQLLTSMR